MRTKNKPGKARKAAKSRKSQSDTETEDYSEYASLRLEGTLGTKSKKIAMLEALEKCFGIIAPAARMATISRETHYEWMRIDPVYEQAVKDIALVKKDMAEYLVVSSAVAGDVRARIELNKKINRDRGYGDKIDVGLGFTPGIQNKHVFIPHNGRDEKTLSELPQGHRLTIPVKAEDTLQGNDIRPVVPTST